MSKGESRPFVKMFNEIMLIQGGRNKAAEYIGFSTTSADSISKRKRTTLKQGKVILAAYKRMNK